METPIQKLIAALKQEQADYETPLIKVAFSEPFRLPSPEPFRLPRFAYPPNNPQFRMLSIRARRTLIRSAET